MTAMPEAWSTAETLTGRFVRLEPLESRHATGLLRAADDEAIFRWLSTARPTDEAAARDLVAIYDALPATVAWAQLDETTSDVVGATAVYEIDPMNRSLAIGYTWLSTRAQRTAVNTEAKLLLLERAFDRLGAKRVTWYTDAKNDRSRAAIARLGARQEGILRQHLRRRDGTWRDTVVFSMVAEEWPDAKAALNARLNP